MEKENQVLDLSLLKDSQMRDSPQKKENPVIKLSHQGRGRWIWISFLEEI